VRAFGDNITKWGTPVVLIETGPASGDNPDQTLIRTNFVALVTALDALASGRVNAADPKRYETLPFNESKLLHTKIVDATILQGSGIAPFIADIGISGTRIVRQKDGERTLGWSSRIDDVGDLRVLGALTTIDASGLTLAPLFDDNAKPGAEVTLPDWKTWKGPTVTIGQPANLLLLKPVAGKDGVYTIERVIRLTEADRRS
jgi:hypothetical protein